MDTQVLTILGAAFGVMFATLTTLLVTSIRFQHRDSIETREPASRPRSPRRARRPLPIQMQPRKRATAAGQPRPRSTHQKHHLGVPGASRWFANSQPGQRMSPATPSPTRCRSTRRVTCSISRCRTRCRWSSPPSLATRDYARSVHNRPTFGWRTCTEYLLVSFRCRSLRGLSINPIALADRNLLNPGTPPTRALSICWRWV